MNDVIASVRMWTTGFAGLLATVFIAPPIAVPLCPTSLSRASGNRSSVLTNGQEQWLFRLPLLLYQQNNDNDTDPYHFSLP